MGDCEKLYAGMHQGCNAPEIVISRCTSCAHLIKILCGTIPSQPPVTGVESAALTCLTSMGFLVACLLLVQDLAWAVMLCGRSVRGCYGRDAVRKVVDGRGKVV